MHSCNFHVFSFLILSALPVFNFAIAKKKKAFRYIWKFEGTLDPANLLDSAKF